MSGAAFGSCVALPAIVKGTLTRTATPTTQADSRFIGRPLCDKNASIDEQSQELASDSDRSLDRSRLARGVDVRCAGGKPASTPDRHSRESVPIFLAHGVIAVALGGAVTGHLVRAHATARLVAALLVTATFVWGFLTIRSFAPLTSAAHAALAAYAALALASTGSVLPMGSPGGRSWQAAVAGVGVMLLILQVALGALVRHHLIGYGWHLLVAGLAALAILAPAVAVSQDAGATAILKRAATLAIASLLVQLSLGVLVLFMIVTGSVNVYAWLLATVTHVVAGTVALLAAARLASVLRHSSVGTRQPADREPADANR